MRPKMKFVIPAAVIVASILAMFSGPKQWGLMIAENRSQCDASSGRLLVTRMDPNLPSYWCWVSTVSEILRWHELPHSSPCELYDLVTGKTTCLDAQNPALKCEDSSQPLETCWRTKSGNNDPGAPETSANRYREEVRGAINVEQRTDAPMRFEEIQEKICPPDSSEGNPFVWAFDNGTQYLHDVVVMGYAVFPPAVAFSVTSDFAPIPAGTRFIKLHDPGNTLDPDAIDYDLYYAARGIWNEEVLISKLRSKFGQVSWLSPLRFWERK